MGWFLFFLIAVPFALMNITVYRKERRKVDEELQVLLRENNDLLKEFLHSVNNN